MNPWAAHCVKTFMLQLPAPMPPLSITPIDIDGSIWAARAANCLVNAMYVAGSCAFPPSPPWP